MNRALAYFTTDSFIRNIIRLYEKSCILINIEVTVKGGSTAFYKCNNFH